MAVPDAFRSRAIAWLIFFARTDSSVVPRPVGKLGADPLAVSPKAFRLSARRLQIRAGRGKAPPLRPSLFLYDWGPNKTSFRWFPPHVLLGAWMTPIERWAKQDMFAKTIELSVTKKELLFSYGRKEARFRPVIYLTTDKKVLAVGTAPTDGAFNLEAHVFEDEKIVDAFALLEAMLRIGFRQVLGGFSFRPVAVRISVGPDIRRDLKGFTPAIFHYAATNAGAGKRAAGPWLNKPVSTDNARWSAAYADCVGPAVAETRATGVARVPSAPRTWWTGDGVARDCGARA
eukprot:gene47310-63403_t